MANIVETDVVIIGAGLSGLATAHYLAAAGLDVQVLEKENRTGGTIETRRQDGFLIDCGPNSALDTTPLLGKMFGALGIAESKQLAADAAKNRYIVRDGRLVALPMSPPAFLKTRLFSRSAKWRLMREPFIPPSDPDLDESLAAFVERRLGREMLDYAINPFVSGVYAGRPETLSVRAAFPRLHEMEQQFGSLIKGAIKGRKERKQKEKSGETSKQSARLFTFTQGMQTMVDALHDARDGAVHTGVNVSAVRKREHGYEVDAAANDGDRTYRSRVLVFAIPAYALADFPAEFEFTVRDALSSIPYPPVSMVFLGYRDAPTTVPLDGFGFLVPEKEGRNILGTIWSSTLFPGRAPEGGTAFTTFVGGSRQPERALLPVGELIGSVRADLKGLLGVDRDPDITYVRLWERAIPQYNVGHVDIIKTLESFEARSPGLYITGNFRGGVSVSDCVKQAHALGAKVSEAFRP
jgi:oxygen-dependent protoporphyrinogen oxidase